MKLRLARKLSLLVLATYLVWTLAACGTAISGSGSNDDCCEPETGEYWGFGIEIAQEIAKQLGVKVEFVQTSWPTLTADVLAEPQKFDFAIGGITITDARCETIMMR